MGDHQGELDLVYNSISKLQKGHGSLSVEHSTPHNEFEHFIGDKWHPFRHHVSKVLGSGEPH